MWVGVGLFTGAGWVELTIFLRVELFEWISWDFDRGWGYIFMRCLLFVEVLNAKSL